MRNLPSYDGVDMYKYFSKTSPDIVNILRQMLMFEPKNRIDPEDALQMEIFDNVRYERLVELSNIDHKVDISIAENVTMNITSYRNIFLEELFPYLRNGGPISPDIIFEENLRRKLIMCGELEEEEEEEEKKREPTSPFDPSSNISYGEMRPSHTTTHLSSGSCDEKSLQTIEINSHGEISRSSSRCSLSSNFSVQTENLEKEEEEDLKLPLLSRSITIGSEKLENPIISPLTRTMRSLTDSAISSDDDDQKALIEDEEDLEKEEMDLNNKEDEEEEMMVSGKLLVRNLEPLYHEIQVEKKSDLNEEEEEEQKKMKSQSENLLCDAVSNKNKLQPIEKKKSVSDTKLQQPPPNKPT